MIVPANARTSAFVSVQALGSSYRGGRAARLRVSATPSLSVAPTLDLATLRRARILSVTCTPAADGTCLVRASVRGRAVGDGNAKVAFARSARVKVRLTATGVRQLRAGDTLVLSAAVPGAGSKTVRSRVR